MASGKTPVKTRIETITPEMAEEWLTKNTHNRPLRQTKVDELVGAIKRGEWEVNGDAIRFDNHGVLSDGQHRLWAIFDSGIACESVVVTGLSLTAQATIDLGTKRSLNDQLRLAGGRQPGKLASVVNYLWKINERQIRSVNSRPSIQQALELWREHEEALAEAITVGDKLRNRLSVSGAMISAVYFHLATIDQEDADIFFQKLTNGIGLVEGDPIYALRAHLERQGSVASNIRGTVVMSHALIIKAWNLYRRGEQITRLTWRSSGGNPEAFPEAV